MAIEEGEASDYDQLKKAIRKCYNISGKTYIDNGYGQRWEE